MILTLTFLSLALLLVSGALGLVLVHASRRAPLTGPRLTGKTVIVERAGGPDVVNVRGVVIAHHVDRITLNETQLIGPHGDVPAEEPVVHIPAGVVLSVSEVTARGAIVVS